MRSRLPFEIEDLILAVWIIGLERMLAASPFSPSRWLLTGEPPLGLAVIAVLLLFLIFTRGPDDTTADAAIMRRILVTGPFFFFLSLYVVVADLVRHANRWGNKGTFPGPMVSRAWRRTAAVPIALAGDAIFMNQKGMVDFAAGDPATNVILAVGDAAIFLFCVAGPRIVAGATTSPWPWLFRFGLFVASAWLGYALPGFLDGSQTP